MSYGLSAYLLLTPLLTPWVQWDDDVSKYEKMLGATEHQMDQRAAFCFPVPPTSCTPAGVFLDFAE
jgi:hypothetical protein